MYSLIQFEMLQINNDNDRSHFDNFNNPTI